jgi:hypothetical protein
VTHTHAYRIAHSVGNLDRARVAHSPPRQLELDHVRHAIGPGQHAHRRHPTVHAHRAVGAHAVLVERVGVDHPESRARATNKRIIGHGKKVAQAVIKHCERQY